MKKIFFIALIFTDNSNQYFILTYNIFRNLYYPSNPSNMYERDARKGIFVQRRWLSRLEGRKHVTTKPADLHEIHQ